MYDPSSPLLRSGSEDGAPPAPEAKARFAEDRLLDAVIWCEIRPGEILTEADAMDDPVTAAKTAFAPTVAIPIPPLMRRNPWFITA